MTRKSLTGSPAGRSMDTVWFGTDEDGEIAVFEAGETGAIPTSITTIPDSNVFESWYDFYYTLRRNGQDVIELPLQDKYPDLFCRPADMEKNLNELLEEGSREDLLVRYADRNDIAAGELYEDDITAPPLLFSGPLNIVLHPYEPDIDAVLKLAVSGKIIAISPLTSGKSLITSKADVLYVTTQQAENLLAARYAPWLSSEDLRKEDRDWLKGYTGLHFYTYIEESGFYEADYHPTEAVKLANLPNDRIPESSLFKFNGVRFSEISALQPFAFSDCDTNGNSKEWIGFDGSVHQHSFYKDNMLLREDQTPMRHEEVLSAGSWKRGALPPEFDTDKISPPLNTRQSNWSLLKWLGFK